MDKNTQQTSLFDTLETPRQPTAPSDDFALGKNLTTKKKRPLYKDLLAFCAVTGGMWLALYSVLNYNALSQLAEFKYQRLKTSVIRTTESLEAKFEKQTVLLDTNIAKANRPSKNVSKLEAKNKAPDLFKTLEVLPSDNRIYIPSIDRNIPLVDVDDNKDWKVLENDIQEGLRNGVVVHPVSRDPGNFGNFFVTGHSSYYAWDEGRYKDVFALLHEVDPGEHVHIFWEGKKYVYLLGEKKVVPPTEVGVLKQPADEKKITLMTCTPIGTNKNRLILTGELVEE